MGTTATSLTIQEAAGHTYGFAVVATDNVGLSVGPPTSAQVSTACVPPTMTVTLGSPSPIPVDSTLTLPGSIADNVPGPYQATVNYGDGTGTSPVTIAADGTFTLSHLYTTANTYQISVVASDGYGGQTTTNTSLTVGSALTVTTNPSNQTVNAGQTVTFTAAASGSPPPTVQWWVSTDGGNTFTLIAGATSTTMSIANTTATQNGYEYEAVFTNSVGTAPTSPATLTVDYAPTVTTNPTSQTVDAGQTTSFTAAASDGNPTPTTVQWEVNTGSGFTNLSNSGVYSGVTTDSLTIAGATAGLNGAQYQAVFSNAAALSSTTTPATLTVDYAPTVTSIPRSVTVDAGQTATFTASASNGNPTPTTVQWQVSTNGGTTFSPIAGATSSTLSLINTTATQNGSEYEAVFSNAAGLGATTTPATLTVDYAPTVMSSPSSVTVDAGQTATFTATASNGNPTTSTVQWQVSTDGGNTFTPISGATSTTLSLTNTSAAQNGSDYEAVFSNAAGFTATTTPATLTVDYAPTVTSSPSSVTIDAGVTTSFTATANDGNPTPTSVQWQVNTGSGFTNLSNTGVYSGVTTDTLTITGVTSALSGAQYQAVFSNAAGLSATTTPATLTVDYAPTVTTNPSNVTINAGQTATFTAAATGNPAATVQWQANTGSGFTNLSNGGGYSGVTTNTLTITGVSSGLNGAQYLAVYTNSVGIATTNTALLTVDYAPTVTSNPTSTTVNAGQTATFTASASNGNPTSTTVQWQVSTNAGSTFTPIAGATSRHAHLDQRHLRPEWLRVRGRLQQLRRPERHHHGRHSDGQVDGGHDNDPHLFTKLVHLRPGSHVHGDGQTRVGERLPRRLCDLHGRLIDPGHRDPQHQRKSDADDQVAPCRARPGHSNLQR